VIVMIGPDSEDIAVAERVAPQFGWRIDTGRDPAPVVAVLLHRDGLSWGEAIRRVRQSHPEARVITCHRFDEPVDWGEFCDLGAFHSIRLPMAEAEVRQSLGFVWAAEERLAQERLAAVREDRKGYGTVYAGFRAGAGALGRVAGTDAVAA